MALVTCPCAFRLRRLAQSLRREVLAWGACGCHVSEVLVWKLLWEALGRFVYQDLVRSAPAADAGPLTTLRGPGMKILLQVFYNSLREDLMEILVKCCQRPLRDLAQPVLVRSSWRGPGDILSVSLHDLVPVLVRSSCGDPVEILLKKSLQ